MFGSCLPVSVLPHITALFPHKPVFILKPLLSLPWHKTSHLCDWRLYWLPGYPSWNGCWEKLGCIWAWHNFRKEWHSLSMLGFWCRLIKDKINSLLLYFLIWAVILLPQWSWNGWHTPCVLRKFHGKNKKRILVLLSNINLRLTLIACILLSILFPLSIFWKVTILVTNIWRLAKERFFFFPQRNLKRNYVTWK